MTDVELLTEGAVAIFARDAVERAAEWLTECGYQVVRVAAGGCATEADLHRELARALELPEYYGQNLDALNDVLRSIALIPGRGLALVLDRYDAFATRHRETAQAVLDVFAGQARVGLVHDRRMLCLVQSDDPALAFEPVGAVPVGWNSVTWDHGRSG